MPYIVMESPALSCMVLYAHCACMILYGPIHKDIVLKQAGAELGQAQLQLELGFTLIKVCCIILMITNYHYISLSTISL